jgi:outer membrane protein assembly factor BamB
MMIAIAAPVQVAYAQQAGTGRISAIDNNRGIVGYQRAPTGLSLPDSPDAVDLIKRAGFEESQNHWENAADLYQQALVKFPNRVIQTAGDSNSAMSHYVGTSQAIQARLAKWPADARGIYQGLYEQTADDLLHAAPPHRAAALLNVFLNYSISDAGKQAGVALVDLYLECGDFRAAQSIGDQLLGLYPGVDADDAMILLRVALADHYCGDDGAFRQLLDRLNRDFPDAVGSIGGKSVRLADALQKIGSVPKPIASAWTGEPGSVPSSTTNRAGSVGNAKSGFISTLRHIAHIAFTPSTAPTSLALIPTLDGSDIFFQDGHYLYAVDSQTGHPLPKWLNTYPGESAGRYEFQRVGTPAQSLHTVAVSPSLVLAVMGQSDTPIVTLPGARGPAVATPVPGAGLVCLDRDTGRLLWTHTPSELPQATTALTRAEYDGTPLLIPAMFTGGNDADGSILVTARTGRFYQFDECYIVCLSARTGEYRWSTYLGGATHDAKTLADPAQMTFADGAVFVMTNLGVIASINPADGKVIWLNAYPHDAGRPGTNIFQNNSPRNDRGGNRSGLPEWAVNPVLVDHGQLYVLPSDSTNLFVANDQTGDGVRTIPMDAVNNASLMLGICDGALILENQRKVFSLDCGKLAARTGPSADAANAMNWTADLSFGDDSRMAGRGSVSGDFILVPTTNRIVQISNGRVSSSYPARGGFLSDQAPGNLVATNTGLVVAGQHATDIYIRSLSPPLRESR